MKRIGLIAGAGNLPILVAKEAKKRNDEVVVISLVDQDWLNLTDKVYYLGAGQIEKIIKTLLEQGIKEVVMIGKVNKDVMFNPANLDQTSISLLSQLKQRDDNAIMSAIVDIINKAGIKVLEQTIYLSDSLAKIGVLTSTTPNDHQKFDIEYGISIARQIAALNIGQTVVVKDRMVLAVESIEGTDMTILRGGGFRAEAVVAKVAKPGHDMRFDIPTIGIETIKRMSDVNASVLAIESGRVLLVDNLEIVREANKNGIIIIGVR